MNYIACADLHIRSNRPQFRKDNYFRTICRKFNQIVFLCNKYNADLIVAGDFFDSVKVGHKVVNSVLKIVKKLKGKMLVVAGQHDMSFHSHDLTGSPLQTFIHADRAILLKRDEPYFDGKHNIYGCSFGEEPVKPETKDSILVIHKAITIDDPPWFLPEALSSEQALDSWEGYFLIIAGDYHLPFTAQKWGNVLINCGPMMRQSIDQMEIEPRAWLIDAEENRTRSIKLKIEPSETVFALDEIKRKMGSHLSEELSNLVEALKDKSTKPDYKETVQVLMDEGNVSDATRNKVNSILGNVIDEN